jgi:outer membrane protein with beta-barrel domain
LTVPARAATTATVLFAVVLVCSPLEARADYLFVPFVGGAFAGKTSFYDPEHAFGGDVEGGSGSTQLIFGGSVGWLSPTGFGFEGDFSYGPRFFETDNEAGLIQGSHLVTVSGSVIVAAPLRFTGYSLRPYLIGGLGLIHSGITYVGPFAPVDDDSLGFNVGGGAIGFLSPRTGVRFELRHFRTFNREADLSGEVQSRLSFWRFTVGVVIRR